MEGAYIGDDHVEHTGLMCFPHANGDVVEPPPPPRPEFDDSVFAGLCAIVLDHTAMCGVDSPTAVTDAVQSLAQATQMAPDFAAGVLLATTWIAAAGSVGDEQLTLGAEMYEAQADGIGIDVAVVDPDDPNLDDPIRYQEASDGIETSG
jgi:hypothetical protein